MTVTIEERIQDSIFDMLMERSYNQTSKLRREFIHDWWTPYGDHYQRTYVVYVRNGEFRLKSINDAHVKFLAKIPFKDANGNFINGSTIIHALSDAVRADTRYCPV